MGNKQHTNVEFRILLAEGLTDTCTSGLTTACGILVSSAYTFKLYFEGTSFSLNNSHPHSFRIAHMTRHFLTNKDITIA